MQHFIIVDSETTCEDTVADFGAIVCDHRGNVVADFACMVLGEYDRVGLFYLPSGKAWSRDAAKAKQTTYDKMIVDGFRVMASPAAINRWLTKIYADFCPTLTGYNLAFDADKCKRTGIDLEQFSDRFCLWHAAVGNLCNQKKYRQFVVENHLFNAPTEKQNMTFRTDAEAVFGFINGAMVAEPHTAIEDARDFELPILKAIIKRTGWRERIVAYDWKKFQVCNHFKAV